MTKRAKKLALAVLAACALLGGAWLLQARAGRPADGDLVPVRRGSFDVGVETIGELDAAQSHELVSTIRGDKAKIVMLVPDGSKVEQGDILVGFDPTFFEAEILRLEGEVRSREAVVNSADMMVELEKSQDDRVISNAQLELANARQEYGRHRAYIKDLEALQREGHAFGSEIVQAQRKAGEAVINLKKAGTEFERLKKEAMLKVAQSMVAVGMARGDLETSRTELDQVRAEYDKTTLRAPISGFVILHEVPSEPDKKRKLQVGDTVWQGQSVLYLPDLSSMIVKTRVREMDLNKLKRGQAAMVQVDAFPGVSFTGQVDSIGVLATDDAGTGGKHFEFTVRLLGGDERLRPGMTARVLIVADSARDVLTVPVAALFFDGSGGSFCYVDEGGALKPRSVRVGRMNADLAEISSGLSEGDRVSLVKP